MILELKASQKDDTKRKTPCWLPSHQNLDYKYKQGGDKKERKQTMRYVYNLPQIVAVRRKYPLINLPKTKQQLINATCALII